MKIAIPKERRPDEARVAASPETVKKYVSLGFGVCVEAGAGDRSSIPDAAFADAGATVGSDTTETLDGADIVLCVQRPEDGALGAMKQGAMLIGNLAALSSADDMKRCADCGITAFALELLPRISRAQSMDILSSQSNLAGYKAVLDAANVFTSAFPMMMTAAGTIRPARLLVLGAGVAGLQAIATARRLGAVVSSYDVRPAVKEQVESLGAKFVEVDPEATQEAETAGGYAKEMSEEYKAKQAQVLADAVAKNDVVICTALIPGRPAPVLVTEEMVRTMQTGSVIVDLAVEQGGNCSLSEVGEVVEKHGVKIVGYANVPSRVATDATAMYAKNLLNFVTPMVDAEKGGIAVDWEDEIIAGCLVTRDGKIVHPMLNEQPKTEEAN
jgi:NAD(P) transhydrogenase subunit alpha